MPGREANRCFYSASSEQNLRSPSGPPTAWTAIYLQGWLHGCKEDYSYTAAYNRGFIQQNKNLSPFKYLSFPLGRQTLVLYEQIWCKHSICVLQRAGHPLTWGSGPEAVGRGAQCFISPIYIGRAERSRTNQVPPATSWGLRNNTV